MKEKQTEKERGLRNRGRERTKRHVASFPLFNHSLPTGRKQHFSCGKGRRKRFVTTLIFLSVLTFSFHNFLVSFHNLRVSSSHLDWEEMKVHSLYTRYTHGLETYDYFGNETGPREWVMIEGIIRVFRLSSTEVLERDEGEREYSYRLQLFFLSDDLQESERAKMITYLERSIRRKETLLWGGRERYVHAGGDGRKGEREEGEKDGKVGERGENDGKVGKEREVTEVPNGWGQFFVYLYRFFSSFFFFPWSRNRFTIQSMGQLGSSEEVVEKMYNSRHIRS